MKRATLEVTVENGELLGLGNGCPYNERGYRTSKTDTYYGEALAVIRAGESGTVNDTGIRREICVYGTDSGKK